MDELNEGIHSKKYICWSTRAIQRFWVVLRFTYYLKLYPAWNNHIYNERNLTYMLLYSNNISETGTHLNSDYFSSVLPSYNWYLMFVYSIIKSFTFARHNSAIICGNEVNVFLSRVFCCIFPEFSYKSRTCYGPNFFVLLDLLFIFYSIYEDFFSFINVNSICLLFLSSEEVMP